MADNFLVTNSSNLKSAEFNSERLNKENLEQKRILKYEKLINKTLNISIAL